MDHILTTRQKQLLRGIVKHHIDTATPVGSDYLVKYCRIECSPATVRNEMSALNELGYLQKPHASAGRIPTDKGYRFYVNSLMRREPVTTEMEKGIRSGIEKAKGDAFLIFEEVSVFLSEISRELAIVMTPQISCSVFDRLELIELTQQKILAIIHVRNRMVKTVVLHIDIARAPHDLDSACRLMNERLSGLTLEEIHKNISARFTDVPSDQGGLLRTLVAAKTELFEFTGPLQIHTSGSQHILSQPEFSNKDMIELLFAFLEDKQSLVDMMHTIDHDTAVAIGEENRDRRLKSFSMITSFYRLGGNVGLVGVIGPTRMQYDTIVPLVHRIAKTMTEYMSS
jgi:heat-inducible transcriptional repressor